MIVDNRPLYLMGELVAQAPPDGYITLVLGNILWMELLVRIISFDPVQDIAPTTTLGMTPNVLFGHPALPVKSTEELISLAQKQIPDR